LVAVDITPHWRPQDKTLQDNRAQEPPLMVPLAKTKQEYGNMVKCQVQHGD
jgi:hypothetical protein